MSGKYFSRIAAVLAVSALCCFNLAAEDGTGTTSSYAPYTVFGLGNTIMPGSAYNRSMGGVGIASRNNKHINILNPAAVTARDSLSFMFDISGYNDNRIFTERDGAVKRVSAHNDANIGDLVMSFPIWKSSAFMFGIAPYMATGYDFSYNYSSIPEYIGTVGNVTSSNSGDGGLYQVFLGAGATFWKRLSLGVEGIYYFGNINKATSLTFSDDSYYGVVTNQNLNLYGLGGVLGLQYEENIGKFNFCLGATYKTSTKVMGVITDTYNLVDKADTLGVNSNLSLSSEKGVGLALGYDNKLRFEFNYTRSDWAKNPIASNPHFAIDNFGTATAQSFRFGFEYVPNRNDIRYFYKRIAYRGGFYWNNESVTIGGRQLSSRGITLGATIPVFRWYNGVTVAMDLGDRAPLGGGYVREFYVNFSLGINVFDIWFQKPKYE